MRLKQAINSGKPFKLPNHNFWLIVKDDKFYGFDNSATGGDGTIWSATIKFSFGKKKQKASRPKWEKHNAEFEQQLYPVTLKPSSVFSDKWMIAK